jgi:hypothetical protein
LLAPRWSRLSSSLDRRERVGKTLVRLRRMRAEAPHVIRELPDLTPLLTKWRRDLARLIAISRAHAHRVLFVPNPWLAKAAYTQEERACMWNFGLGRPYQEQLDTYLSPEVASAALQQLADEGLAIARAAGCGTLDLRARIPSDLEHYYDFLHHTPLGNRRVGEELARAVLAGAAPAPMGSAPAGEPAHPRVAEDA